jgi:hypothetical protein
MPRHDTHRPAVRQPALGDGSGAETAVLRSLAGVLAFVGLKLVLHAHVEIPTGLSLAVVAILLGAGILASAMRARGDRRRLAAGAGEA